jgi:hypothetical protein
MSLQCDLFSAPTLRVDVDPPRKATAREIGRRAAEACLSKAERTADFNAAGAAKFIVSWLERHGPTSGEVLTDEAKQHGFRPGEDRAFGPIYAMLNRKGVIRCVGYCTRQKGRGTAGGRLWSIA